VRGINKKGGEARGGYLIRGWGRKQAAHGEYLRDVRRQMRQEDEGEMGFMGRDVDTSWLWEKSSPLMIERKRRKGNPYR